LREGWKRQPFEVDGYFYWGAEATAGSFRTVRKMPSAEEAKADSPTPAFFTLKIIGFR